MKRYKSKTSFVKSYLSIKLDRIISKLAEKVSNKTSEKLNKNLTEIKLLIANQLIHDQQYLNSVSEAEFSVFSQWGDDGIIQFLIKNIEIKNEIFIEFGVEDYTESNTRFLLINNNWEGLVIDSLEENIDYIRNDEIFWKYSLKAKKSFITAENINTIIEEEGFNGQIGILHIDIDGMDYWIWKALKVVEPQIVIIEYNSVFGNERAITVPYNADFQRSKYHYSFLYWGASLPALVNLSKEKGYEFIGCNKNGNNAYFVKSNYLNDKINKVHISKGYVESKFRESRNELGELNYLSKCDRLNQIKNLPVFNVINEKIEKI